ncbi:MAG TPA: zinc ribbon domain-containing protein [Candidatus Limnocylindria bacterium]|nr:zinc ribbon domain-containing protein [Candidatus Limnocylindria bacterium]
MTAPDPGLRQQAATRSFLRAGGAVALGLGVLLTGIALFDFLGAMGSFEQPKNFWMGFIGLPLIAIGGATMKAGYLGPASRYVAGELTPTIRDSLGALGLAGATRTCPACGATNAAEAKFCDDCGTALPQT